jgi:hypothetical protein
MVTTTYPPRKTSVKRTCVPAVLLVVLFALHTPADSPEPDKAIEGLYDSGKLFDRKEYKTVRAAFAQRFEDVHRDTITRAWGADHGPLSAWLKEHVDLREEFFTALDERHDDLHAALALFRDLWKASPERVAANPALAIATAVVWDRPDWRAGKGGGVYDYRHHQVRTKSTLPDGLAGAKDNFDYVIDNDKALGGLPRMLPWEFLVYVVDHKTPIAERKWAHKYYLSRRGKVASWHQDIKYDKGMLEYEQSKGKRGRPPALSGHAYTLENIKKCGGVCAQQADFAARVGKSLGQPSMYVAGESSYRGWHAWVMWVQVAKPAGSKAPAAGGKVRFTLVSDGRTRGFERDLFYTGWVTDPQTGEKLLDRDMDRRLWTVGQGPEAKRQADLAMRAYPGLRDRKGLDTAARIAYLDRVLRVSPYNEQAWVELASMAKAGELPRAGIGTPRARSSTLVKSFAAYPDFVWRISADMLAGDPSAAERLKHLQLVGGMCEKAGRPDLTCAARLKITEELATQKKWKDAASGLNRIVRKYTTEGRYVPRLMQELEKVCDEYPAAVNATAQLYVDMAPALYVHYRGEGPFVAKVLQQASAFIDGRNLTKYSAAFKRGLALARAKVKQ